MQAATKQAEARVDDPSERRGDLFDPHFPNIRAASKAASSTREPLAYDPHSLHTRGPRVQHMFSRVIASLYLIIVGSPAAGWAVRTITVSTSRR